MAIIQQTFFSRNDVVRIRTGRWANRLARVEEISSSGGEYVTVRPVRTGCDLMGWSKNVTDPGRMFLAGTQTISHNLLDLLCRSSLTVKKAGDRVVWFPVDRKGGFLEGCLATDWVDVQHTYRSLVFDHEGPQVPTVSFKERASRQISPEHLFVPSTILSCSVGDVVKFNDKRCVIRRIFEDGLLVLNASSGESQHRVCLGDISLWDKFDALECHDGVVMDVPHLDL